MLVNIWSLSGAGGRVLLEVGVLYVYYIIFLCINSASAIGRVLLEVGVLYVQCTLIVGKNSASVQGRVFFEYSILCVQLAVIFGSKSASVQGRGFILVKRGVTDVQCAALRGVNSSSVIDGCVFFEYSVLDLQVGAIGNNPASISKGRVLLKFGVLCV